MNQSGWRYKILNKEECRRHNAVVIAANAQYDRLGPSALHWVDASLIFNEVGRLMMGVGELCFWSCSDPRQCLVIMLITGDRLLSETQLAIVRKMYLQNASAEAVLRRLTRRTRRPSTGNVRTNVPAIVCTNGSGIEWWAHGARQQAIGV